MKAQTPGSGTGHGTGRERRGVMPQRIQRRRTKGWRLPDGAVVVGRPGKWGNPYKVGIDGDAALCVAKYRQWLINTTPEAFVLLLVRMREQLGGKDLACWCPLDQPCHADVLLALANAPLTAPPAETGRPTS